MKAVQIDKHGSREVLKVVDIKEPECLSDDIKVKIKACSINHLDIWVRNGLPGLPIQLPLTLGSDASGTIVEIGSNIKDYFVGDDVVIQPGTYNEKCKNVLERKENCSRTYGILGETENGVQSEYVILKQQNIHTKPKHLTFEESASMQLVYMTAYQMLCGRAGLLSNNTVLIYGATSGVGSAAIQIAKDIGSYIITTVGTKDKIDYAYKMGADEVILHSIEDYSFIKKIKKLTNKIGVDVIFEHIGAKSWDRSMKCLNIGGKIVVCGATTGPKIKIDLRHLFMKQQTIFGSTMSNIHNFKKVMEKIDKKVYKPFVDKVFRFNEVVLAHKYIEERKNKGKVILIP